MKKYPHYVICSIFQITDKEVEDPGTTAAMRTVFWITTEDYHSRQMIDL